MATKHEEEREALKAAAVATGPILTRLRQQRADLDRRILRLEAVVAAYEETIGGRRRRAREDGQQAKVPRGQVRQHVEAVFEKGGDFTESELRQEIFTLFGIMYARSSVYVVLRRGLKVGRYELKDGKRWRAVI